MRRAALVLAILLCLIGSSLGCSSTMMQGTPFYTGPSRAPEGKAPDRVNLWPLVYYQHPVLSVLWPLGKFDSAEHRSRFFPAYWGSPEGQPAYFRFLPLVWYREGDYAGVFPLYLRYLRPGGSSVHVLWPIVNWKTGQGETGWRVWPLYGGYSDTQKSRRYALWPFIMSLHDGAQVARWALPFYVGARGPKGSWDLILPLFFRQVSDAGRRLALFPLFYDSRDAAGNRTFLSPLYMMGRNGPSVWDLIVPVYFRSKSPAGTRLVGFPLFYKTADAEGHWTFVSPIYSGRRGADSSWDLALPVYFRHRGPESRTTVVLPVYYGAQRGSMVERLLFPIFYKWTDGDASLLLTLPYGLRTSGQTRTAYAFPLLSALTTSPEGKELWALFPLSRWRWKDGLQEAHVLPLFYWNRQSDTFLSLPYARWHGEDVRYTSVLGPLYVRTDREGAHRTSVLWPLTSFRKGQEAAGSYVFPLYTYSREGERSSLNLALLLGQFHWLPDKSHFWLLAGLAGRMGEQDRVRSHFWPLYRYQRAPAGTQLDLGPFLPIFTSRDDPQPTLSLGGYRHVGEDRRHHFFPLWYWRSAKDWWHLNLGLLLADYVRTADGTDLSLLWPVFSRWSHPHESGHHVWPLYSYGHEGDATTTKLGPFLGPLSLIGRTTAERSAHTWAFPFFLKNWTYSARWLEAGDEHHVDVQNRRFSLFPLVWQRSSNPLPQTEQVKPYESGRRRSYAGRPVPNGYLTVFPLFGSRYTGDPVAPEGTAESSFWLLGPLYDSKTRLTPAAEAAGKPDVYVRRRILWRVMNYERVNDSTSLDAFPGITYDKTPGKKKVVSFLWRVFRYEWDRDKGTRVHALFIPFGGGKAEAEPAAAPG